MAHRDNNDFIAVEVDAALVHTLETELVCGQLHAHFRNIIVDDDKAMQDEETKDNFENIFHRHCQEISTPGCIAWTNRPLAARKVMRPLLAQYVRFWHEIRYRPKGVFGKGVGNSKNASEMRQKCVRNASKMRQKCVKMGLVLLGKEERSQNASEMRQICVKNASKMRGTPLGENTFWTIPRDL